jgi:dTDP-4-dehydrorhamnose reductase
MGFTDVYFNPLLVNDLSRLLLEMMDKSLSGLYHVVSRESVTKYNFGIALAQRFNLDPALITPTPVTQSDLKAARSPKLTLRCDKFTRIMGIEPPSWREGLDRFYELKQLGYPQMLRSLGC